ncbi:MAG: ATP-binding protein [bacterium]|nr:ATP-binding protein [bacterium]
MVSLSLARGIKHSINELVLEVKGVAGGEIVERIDLSHEDEFEWLGKHVKKLIERMYLVNKDLEHSRRMLIQSEKLASLGQISAGIAHEIRNPLTAIKMLIFALQNEHAVDTQMKTDFRVILKEIERMENFLENFLNFARPPEPDFEVIDVNQVIAKTLNLLSPQIISKNIKLIENFSNDNTTVYGDKDQLQIVFMNILLNAIQAISAEGTIKVESKNTRNTLRIQDIFQIVISDNGTGVPAEIMKSIFDPFVSSKKTGTGLGLSIAYQIIHIHGGWIDASNNDDHGATFTINLPFKEKRS